MKKKNGEKRKEVSKRKITRVAETSYTYNGVVLRYGRTCSKNVLNDTANRRTREWGNVTKLRILVWTTITSNRKN